MKRKSRWVPIAAVLAVLITGCGREVPMTTDPAAALPGAVHITGVSIEAAHITEVSIEAAPQEESSETDGKVETIEEPEPDAEPAAEPAAIEQTTARQGTGDAELDQLCDNILNGIVNDDMGEREKAYAVYTWVTNHITYRGNSAIGDWVAGAKTALTRRSGNCYAFYSASRALLTRLGFENIEVQEYTGGHYWNMVKVDGSWWHFDATTGWGAERFLWTSDQILNYSYTSEQTGVTIIYEWDPAGYPQTP